MGLDFAHPVNRTGTAGAAVGVTATGPIQRHSRAVRAAMPARPIRLPDAAEWPNVQAPRHTAFPATNNIRASTPVRERVCEER
jgi:hypothetical protein